MPFCPNCGNSINPQYSFCPNCGTKLLGVTGDSLKQQARIRVESSIIPGLFGNYEGEVEDGLPNGMGDIQYDNGITYIGLWINGKKNGSGVYAWPNGKKYEGEFDNDHFCGQGKMSFPNGCRYEGEFCNSQMNGNGIMIYPDGNRYVGNWKDDCFKGPYRFYFSDGRFYEGNDMLGTWEKPKPGKGLFSDEKGNRYFFTESCSLVREKGKSFIYAFKLKLYFVIKWSEGEAASLLGVFLSVDLADNFCSSVSLNDGEKVDVFGHEAINGDYEDYWRGRKGWRLPDDFSSVFVEVGFNRDFEKKTTLSVPILFFTLEEFEDWKKKMCNDCHYSLIGSVYYSEHSFNHPIQFFAAKIEDLPQL